MRDSLVDLTRQHLTPDVVARLAALTRETPPAVQRALAGATSAVVASLLQTAASPGGLEPVTAVFAQGRLAGPLDESGRTLAAGGPDALVKGARPLLGTLFGSRTTNVAAVLAEHAGIERSSAITLLSLGAPVVMHVASGALAARGGATPATVRDLLVAQRGTLGSAPAGLASALGIGDLASLGANLAVQAGELPTPGPLDRLLPVMIAIAAVLFLLSIVRSIGGGPTVTTDAMDTARHGTPTAESTATR